ncbi:MAG TPA: chorismate synthase [Dissulfurispiraceae bacterium]|nr:chorismate synthase [Dissulfurispiraceae bacterium]
MLLKLRFLTAGESHGRGLISLLEGIPSGLALNASDIDADLKRRQQGYGRGGRMKIEQDRAIILTGVRWGKTIGSPISLLIENRDWENWCNGMSPDAACDGSIPPVTRPRPGHADLAGAVKYGHKDVRNILERSSARETAARVAAGAVARKFLAEFGITIGSYVIRIGSVALPVDSEEDSVEIISKAESSEVRCPDNETSSRMIVLIDEARQKGDTLGGIFKVIINGIPAGLGSHIQWDKRLNSRLMAAISSIQAVKGVEIGLGFRAAERFGSDVMDVISYSKDSGFGRHTNNAGGIEGGISNGMPIVIRAAMKPIPTLRTPLRSTDLVTKEAIEAAYERSDTCAVPAASVIAEAMASICIADAMLEKFGGDTIDETKRNFFAYKEYIRQF